MPTRPTPIAILMLGWSAMHASALTIVRDGEPAAVIVVAPDAPAPCRTAATELQEHLRLVTGGTLQIVGPAEAPAGKTQLCVGPSVRTKALLPALDVSKLSHDGIVTKTVGDALVLMGRPPRGTLYAVYTFLEDAVGCRWWTSTESTFPKRSTLEIGELDTVYAPALRSREAFYRDAFSSPFAARLKLNGHHMRIPPEYGGHLELVGWCHTFYRLVPPEQHFADHPEWFSEINGQRVQERAQLCLANEAARKELTRVALEWLRGHPDAGIISISQNDCRGRCRCAQCRAVEEAEGAASGPLIHFVNAVAADIEKEFPEVLVETLAYSYTRHAPRHVKPRRNVLIRLCSIECSFAQPLGTGPQNEDFRRDVEQWSAIAPQLYVWNYVTNFSNLLLPHPNLRPLAEDIRFFVAHKTLGLFEQGDAYTTTGDFTRMRAWVLAHLMWDPSRDQGELIREFMGGYFGAAALPLLEYFDVLGDAVEESGFFLRCFTNSTARWLSLPALSEATRLFDRAAAAVADNPELARRVARERLTLDHVWLERYHALRDAAAKAGVPFLGPDDPAEACRLWIDKQHELGNRFYGEGRVFDQYAKSLSRRFRPAGPPPDLCKNLPKEAWRDRQDTAFSLHGQGKWVEYVDDPKASNGSAVRMPANHPQWATQCLAPADLPPGTKWHCYVVARCEAKAATGNGLQVGVYDAEGKRGVFSRTVPLEEVAGDEYHTLDLGVHDLTPEMYFWVAPCNNPEAVEAVFVDRLFIVREGEA